MFAVIQTGGKQYKVSEGDILDVEKLDGEEGDQIVLDKVLMLGGSETLIGTPFVEGASVAARIIKQTRAAKIIVFKKKRRKNYRRKKGHRQHITVLKIADILTKGAKPEKAAKPAKEKAAKPETTAAPAALFAAPEGASDDLKKISGVGPVLEKKLNALGITTFAQVAAFSKEDIDKVDDALSFKGRIERDNWLDQAKTLAAETK